MTQQQLRDIRPGESALDVDGAIEASLLRWDGEDVVIRRDRITGTWIVIAVHSTQRGAASGGTRMKTYPDLPAAVNDALRLSAAMTEKFILAGLPRGGGKAVIAVPSELDGDVREGLLRRYGSLVSQLGGLFNTGPDVGTTSRDMDIVAGTGAPYVFGRTTGAGGSGDSGPPTALGVFHAIKMTVEWLFGDSSVAGKRVLIQGIGSVGAPLLRRLVEAHALVLASDVNTDVVRAVQAEFDVQSVEPDAVYDTPCDIFAPCALGGVLNSETIARLQCRAVVGSANNQLQSEEDAQRLKERNILYAPDIVANVGGTISLVGGEAMGWSRDDVERRIVETVTQTLRQVFDRAEKDNSTTVEAARRIIRLG